MRYRLRTLLIVLALGPLLLALGWWRNDAWRAEKRRRTAEQQIWLHYVHTVYSDDLTKSLVPDDPNHSPAKGQEQ